MPSPFLRGDAGRARRRGIGLHLRALGVALLFALVAASLEVLPPWEIGGGSPAQGAPKGAGGEFWQPLGGGTNGSVYALAVSGSGLYVGGTFAKVSGDSDAAKRYLIRWDDTGWNALRGSADATVYALAVSADALYAGGDFTSVGGVSADHVARWGAPTPTPTPTPGGATVSPADPTPTVGPVPTEGPTAAPTAPPAPIPTPLPVEAVSSDVPGLALASPGLVVLSASGLASSVPSSLLPLLGVWEGRDYPLSSTASGALATSGLGALDTGSLGALPVFAVRPVPEGGVVSLALNLTLSAGAGRVSDLALVKISDAATARPFALVSSPSGLAADGTFGLWDGQRFLTPSDVLEGGRSCTLILSIRDGGPYDLDPTPGALLDPCVLGFRPAPTATTTPTPRRFGGGCNAGSAPLALLLGMPLSFLLQKRR
ncbi:Synerg-CTERM sorting domain-containing protein [Aminomonas paucivorans]|uniref:Synerg-CTERM sorting domain-containing protein n=1 Tax=Aminomonas paucivorans TaxID=81412 RepID=UPI00331A6057